MSLMDEIRLAKGFIMHKMYHLGYVSGRHTSIDNLAKSCPERCRPHINVAISELFQERHLVKKPTSYGPQVTAVRSQTGYYYANFFRREFKIEEEEYGKPYRPKKVQPLSDDELHALKLRKKR